MKLINLINKDKLIKEKISKYEYKRFLFEKLYIKRPFKSILGLRGVGKTTLLVQLAIKNNGFYINLDDISLKSINLLELLSDLNEKYDYNYFLLDEIQSLENWENQIKDIFELTDWEYLLFKKGIKIKKINLIELLDFKFRAKKILEISTYEKYLKDYFNFGAYPFSEDLISTIDSFKNILNKTIYSDFVKIRNMDEKSSQEILKILKYISSRADEISITSLSNNLAISKTKIISLISLLEKAMLIIRIEPKVIGKDLLKKHPKYLMLLPIRNLVNKIYDLETNIGNLREDMFITSMFYLRNEIFFLKTKTVQPDFYYNKIIFEIGGKSKSRKQLKDFKNSYVVKDSLEFDKKTIPLILFGFLY